MIRSRQFLILLSLLSHLSFADERTPLHIGANMAGTIAAYEFFNLMGKAACRDYGQKDPCKNTKEMLVLAIPLMLVTGLFIEATQSIERKAAIDKGDLGANLLGVALGAGAVFAFDL